MSRERKGQIKDKYTCIYTVQNTIKIPYIIRASTHLYSVVENNDSNRHTHVQASSKNDMNFLFKLKSRTV